METKSELLPLLETLYESSNPTRRWLHCSRRDWIVGKLRECARERRGRAIEIGFGAGIYLPALAEAFAEVVASDLDQAHLDHARSIAAKYPNIELVRDDILDSRLPAHSFNLALCSEVIEHISGTERVLAGIHRLLKSGGTLLLSTPQRWSLMEMAAKIAFLPGIVQIVRRIYGEAVFDMEHTNLMTARETERQLNRAGFRIRERYKSGMYIPLVAEFAGERGRSFEEWVERRVRGHALDSMLWTQYYVAEA
ncbi:MAG: methyltransferase domain-containing protein [Candidatus Binataceae bacterium]|jgi:2-polyprenyl-3-methyl-5-hydroxy-6-metoxy-1,4-benzoquinol methylase